jgi:hypothetical protein
MRIKVYVDSAEDLEDLEHYADCGFHSDYLLGLLVDGAHAARARAKGKFPLGIALDLGEYRPGFETESDVDEPTTEDVTSESDNPFAPQRQTTASA